MIITNKLTLDLQKPGTVPTIYAVQNDSYSRNLEIALYADRQPFVFPETGRVVVRYKKSDGKGGEYDTLPDGTPAWWADRNVLTIALAPQVLTVPGSCLLSVTLLDGGTQLSIFLIRLAVEPIAAAKPAASENYFYITGLLPAPATGNVGQYLRIAAVNKAGRITALEASDSSITPQKGIDYWTAADKESIVQEVITALGTPVFGRVDHANNIILTGALSDGTYTLKYENADGNVTTIGTLAHTTGPDYINQIPASRNADGTLFNNGQGWTTGYRLTSGGSVVEAEGTEITGFIPAKYGDILRLYNVIFYDGTNAYLCLYDDTFAFLGSHKPMSTQINTHLTEGIPITDSDLTSIGFHGKNFVGDATKTAYIRLCCAQITTDSIATINYALSE